MAPYRHRRGALSGVLSRSAFYFPALVSGALMAVCFTRPSPYWIAFFALVPVLVFLSKLTKTSEALKAGLVFGMVYFSGSLYWIYHSIYYYGKMPFVGAVAAVLLLCLILSLYTALFAVLFWVSIRRSVVPALWLAPMYWVIVEYMRTYLLTGFPWASVAYTQHNFLQFIQVADTVGAYGISALVLAVNGAIADLFILSHKRRTVPLFPAFPFLFSLTVLVAIMVGVFMYGSRALSTTNVDREVSMSIIQGNISQDQKWSPSLRDTVFDTYARLSIEAASERPELIIWPESAVPFIYGYDRAGTERLQEFSRSLGIPLLLGSLTVLPEKNAAGQEVFANSALLMDAQGQVAYQYDKSHLVPFGEYVPLKNALFFVKRLAVGIGDYKSGEKFERGVLPFGEFGTLICYEIIFPGIAREFFKTGGNFLVTVTNDAWFGTTVGPQQHFNMAVLRAIETRKPIMRAANTGISGLIDSKGRVVASTSLFEQRVLTVRVPLDSTHSRYVRYGDLVVFLALAGASLVLFNLKRHPM